MENTFGSFLKEKRLEKGLTQKELASFLIVSESAVSKWEKDVARPDISLLPKLSEILGVSEHELITASIDNEARQDKTQARKWRALSTTWSWFFYIAYAAALLPCFICNLAIQKTLSWFWIVLSALVLAFSFTNLPKWIKKYKLLFIPLSNFLALCLLLAVCAAYTNGNWFWIASLPVLLGCVTVFLPIYIARYQIFSKIKRFNDFISIGVDFVLLNVMLIVIDGYAVRGGFALNHWYFSIALPIVAYVYFALNLLLCVRFLKVNSLIKTAAVLLLIPLFVYIPPLFLHSENAAVQKELDSVNIFQADFSIWRGEVVIERNVHCIVVLSLVLLGILFLVGGLAYHIKKKKQP
ncbi:MAG: helix-turn-helix transcriptional regulator [Clostridiales bacterium]|nr:helix-turn-helix transcriptional regulator [Clostridiales bacterium]